MDPFSMLIGITIAAYVVGGVTADAWAVATRQTPPSIQKARDRHERKMARGEDSNPAPSYLGRIVGNAAERWATNSDQRHRDKLQWIEEQGPHRGQRWLERKRRNADRYERAAQTFADKRGQLWGATKDAVQAARERRAEGHAHRRNTTEPDLLDREDWHPDDDLDDRPEPAETEDETEDEDAGPGATVLEFTRPDNARPTSQSKPQTEPQQISDGADIWGDPADPATWTGTDGFGRDIQTGEGERYTDPSGGVVHDSDQFLLGDDVSPERRMVQQHQYDLDKLTERQVRLLRRWRRMNITNEPVEFTSEEWNSLPAEMRGRLLDESVLAGTAPCTVSADGEQVPVSEVDTEAAQYMRTNRNKPGGDQHKSRTNGDHPQEQEQEQAAEQVPGPDPVFDPSVLHPRVAWAYAHLEGEQRRERLARLAGAEHWRGTGISDEQLAEQAHANLPDDPRHPEVAAVLDADEGMGHTHHYELAEILGVRPAWEGDRDPDVYWDSLDGLAVRATRVLDTPDVISEPDLMRKLARQSSTETTTNTTPGGVMSEQTSTATTTGEIASLQDALAYTRTMSSRLSAIQAEADGMGAQLNALHSNATASVQEIEQAVADLAGNDVKGNHVATLIAAGEDMTAMAESARQAANQLSTVSESATTAQTAFSTAHQSFAAQTSLEEEIQTANASGNRAGQRKFYENA